MPPASAISITLRGFLSLSSIVTQRPTGVSSAADAAMPGARSAASTIVAQTSLERMVIAESLSVRQRERHDLIATLGVGLGMTAGCNDDVLPALPEIGHRRCL